MYILFFLLHFKCLYEKVWHILFLQEVKAAVPLHAKPCLIAGVANLRVVFSQSTSGLGSVKFS